MSAPPWMLVRLALDTAVHHTQADEDRLAALQITTRDEYRRFLVRIYGFEAAVERGLERLEEHDPLLARGSTRTARLQADLEALGMTAAAIEKLPRSSLVQIRTWSIAFGWLFVLERQTLLAGLIRRHLLHVLGYGIQPACSYLAMYGETPGARFRSFGVAVSEHAARYVPGPIVAAAGDAFRAQRQWYRRTREESTTPAVDGVIRDGAALDM